MRRRGIMSLRLNHSGKVGGDSKAKSLILMKSHYSLVAGSRRLFVDQVQC